MAICPVCGKLNPAGTRNCDVCGAPLASGQGNSGAPAGTVPRVAVADPQIQHDGPASGPVCPICGRGNRSASVFCSYCGYRFKPVVNSNGHNPQPYVLPGTNNSPIPAQQLRQPAPPTIPSDEAGNIPSGTLLK